MCIWPVFILFNVFHEQIKTFEILPPKIRDVVVSGDGYYFYRDVAH